MTQLARPDLARCPSGRDRVRPDRATSELVAAGHPGRPRAARPVPGWVVGTAFLAPAVLIAGWLIGAALQPASYSPMRETVSALAGYSGTDRWVMTAALLVVGACQIATGAGLTAVRVPARVLLIATGLSTIGIAVSPEPAAGPTTRHLAFAVVCVVATAVWPVLVVSRANRATPARRAGAASRAMRGPTQPWILSARGCATATALFAGLSLWLLVAARSGAADLGLVERLTSALQGLFPFVVALALRHAARGARAVGEQGPRGQERSR
jgi:hypothetical membrane protein